MARVGQIGIALGVLGSVLAFMGLFPGVTGLEPTPGLGLLQLVTVLTGLSLLIIGALIYVKFTFYTYCRANLAQQIAVRLSLTSLLFATLASMADILGFGSNPRIGDSDIFFGPWQAGGLIGGFVFAALGVLLYAVVGPEDDQPPSSDE
jgi:hypothetical protein